MAALEDIRKGSKVEGLSPTGVVSIKSVEACGTDAIDVIYQEQDGQIHQQVILRSDAARLRIVDGGHAWTFDADGAQLKLAAEARRIELAYLFDPFLAVHTSKIQPLPHQISAVYGDMLRAKPLRFLLADDPGAGKTIMAGLLIKELMIRGDLERCLIVAPGNLVEQWQDELADKLGLNFDLLTRDMIEAARTGNPLQEKDLLIARLDMLSRSEDLIERLKASPEWDLVVADEAHKMSAHYSGNDVDYTKRYRLGQTLAEKSRHLLLMSATPHNGKQDDFELFMALLDPDRFEGRERGSAKLTDVSDLMRRMVKEELVTFEGKKLFPPRQASTQAYRLSPKETALYDAVTDYVRDQMGRADEVGKQDNRRRLNVGFALQTLQRRLASSPLAIYRSLQRRRVKLESKLEVYKRVAREPLIPEPDVSRGVSDETYWDDIDDTPEEELERLEDELVDQATAARTVPELEAEIGTLRVLEADAKTVLRSNQDRKWSELSSILEMPELRDADGNRRKLIIFTEPRESVEYVTDKVRDQLGNRDAVVVIHGGVRREERREVIEAFQNNKDVLVMVANDAACEGINLQRAHLMINYDLPWNPNKLEQRFGRIHRIGQREVCHVWNLVAIDTREGDVYHRLLEKLEAARNALGGRVYDVMGQLFDREPLRDIMVRAIRYGQRPEVRAEIDRIVDNAFDRDHVMNLLDSKALVRDTISLADRNRIREDMERAEARRLQPGYIQQFFMAAFDALGGRVHPREEGRWEVTRVPAPVQHFDRATGMGQRVGRNYERICFERKYAADSPPAAYVSPGHALLNAVIGKTLEKNRPLLQQGAVLVDPSNRSTQPRLLFFLEMSLQDGRRNRHGKPVVVSRELLFLEVSPDGTITRAGPAPYLDYESLDASQASSLGATLKAPWLAQDHESKVRVYAVQELLPERLNAVRDYYLPLIDKTEREVKLRLNREINYWDGRAHVLRAKEEADKKPRVNSALAAQRAEDLAGRLQRRVAELALQRNITATAPVVTGGCLVIPKSMLESSPSPEFSVDPVARKAIEVAAMNAVMAAERALGHDPRDVSYENAGYDIESKDGKTGQLRFIEVKGRVKGATTVTITHNEQRCAFNNPAQWTLAVVVVDGANTELRYARGVIENPPMMHQAALVLDLAKVWQHGSLPS